MSYINIIREKIRNGIATPAEVQRFEKFMDETITKEFMADRSSGRETQRSLKVFWEPVRRHMMLLLAPGRIAIAFRTVAVIGLFFLILFLDDSRGYTSERLFTGIGCHQLADGTQVTLSDLYSKVTVTGSFNKNERLVELSGKACFDVADDASKPFKVATESLVTTVLGTEFDIEAYPDTRSITIMVLRGMVYISDRSGIKLDTLKARQMFVFDQIAQKGTKLENEDVSAYLVKGFLSKPLSQVMKEIEVKHHVRVKYTGYDLRECTLSGILADNNDLSTTLDALEKAMEAKFTLKENVVTVHGYSFSCLPGKIKK